MTDEELDEYFVHVLKTILEEYKEYAACIKTPVSEDDQEMMEDYDYVIQDITEILSQVTCIEDLAEMDEDTITAVYNYIDEHATNFVIAADGPQREKDMSEHGKLVELLDLFLDNDSEEEL